MREEREMGGRREGDWRIGFWNVAGLKNKDEEFWKGLKKWDVIVMMETWLDRKGWIGIKGRLPRGYSWGVQRATRKNKRGRAMGGMVMGIRRELIEKERGIKTEKEGIIVGKIKLGMQRWRIVGVYIKDNMEGMLQKIEEWVEEKGGGYYTLIGGDFNAWTGMEGGGYEMGGEEGSNKEDGRRKRRSKDGKINKEGKKLISFLEERGWGILNGCTKGDEEGEYTFIGGKGSTVIDYILGDEELREKVTRFRVGEEVDSDHHPVEVWIKRLDKRKRKIEGERGAREGKGVWNMEGCQAYKEGIEKILLREGVGGIEKEDMEGEIKNVIKGVERKMTGRVGISKGWWDEECKIKKREVRRRLRVWRRRGGGDRI